MNILDRMRLDGKVAIVTGGAGGIGSGLAHGLAEVGASVVLADIDGDGAKKVADELVADGFSAIATTTDVGDLEADKAMVEQARKHLGGVDILINNASILPGLPRTLLMETPLEMFDEFMHANCWGMIACAQAAVPAMLERGRGAIINISSTGAFGGSAGSGTIYRVTKYAMASVTDSLAKILGPQGVTVNMIAPGMIQTPGSIAAVGEPGSDRRAALLARIPVARPDREPVDLVGTVLLLCSAAGDYINGQTLIVDGGENTRL